MEIVDHQVAVCRDAAKGRCLRPSCKYYHIPIPLPPAPVMAAARLSSQIHTTTTNTATSPTDQMQYDPQQNHVIITTETSEPPRPQLDHITS